MRPVILLLIVFGQTGCLLAPSRPGGPGGGDDCLPAGAKLGLSATAALERPDRDTLIRAGHAGSGWYLYFYPSTTRTSQCPERTFELTGDDIKSIDAIEPAVVSGTAPDLLTLVSFTNGDSAVIDVRLADGALSEVGRVVASGYQPVPIPTLTNTEATGFVALQASKEIWFGGGRQYIAVASAVGGIHGTATKIQGVPDTEGWYHAVAVRNPHNGKDFALIGSGSSYEAVASAFMIDTMPLLEHDNCAFPPDCHGRLAFTLSSPSPVNPAESFSIDRTTGDLETIASLTTGFAVEHHAPPNRGADSVLDAASGELVGDNKTDIAMLWGSGPTSRELIVYDAMLANMMASSISQRKFESKLDRVEILRTDGEPHILLLSDDPLANAEHCLRMTSTTLEECP
jgi:hypothetical protein